MGFVYFRIALINNILVKYVFVCVLIYIVSIESKVFKLVYEHDIV